MDECGKEVDRALGTVTEVSCDNLLPLFTSFVCNPDTTPHIQFQAGNVANNSFFGNTSGRLGPASFQPIDSIGSNTTLIQKISTQLKLGDLSGSVRPSQGGLPDGGTLGQVLTKHSSIDFDATWVTPQTGGGNGGGGGLAANGLPGGGLLGQILQKNSANNYDATWITPNWVTPDQVHSMPAGGTRGQMLMKNSATDFDAGWGNLAIGEAGPAGATNLANTTELMAGTGTTFTLLATGRALFLCPVGIIVYTAAQVASAVLRIGTGALPARGSAPVGEELQPHSATGSTNNAYVNMTYAFLKTGLEIGTQYWLDFSTWVTAGQYGFYPFYIILEV